MDQKASEVDQKASEDGKQIEAPLKRNEDIFLRPLQAKLAGYQRDDRLTALYIEERFTSMKNAKARPLAIELALAAFAVFEKCR